MFVARHSAHGALKSHAKFSKHQAESLDANTRGRGNE
jgi:hypothetical protein